MEENVLHIIKQVDKLTSTLGQISASLNVQALHVLLQATYGKSMQEQFDRYLYLRKNVDRTIAEANQLEDGSDAQKRRRQYAGDWVRQLREFEAENPLVDALFRLVPAVCQKG